MKWQLKLWDFDPSLPYGITYIVDLYGIIHWWPRYTRHRWLADRACLTSDEVAWGGILNSSGEWVRGSYDYGDAPSLDARDQVVALLNEALAKMELL